MQDLFPLLLILFPQSQGDEKHTHTKGDSTHEELYSEIEAHWAI